MDLQPGTPVGADGISINNSSLPWWQQAVVNISPGVGAALPGIFGGDGLVNGANTSNNYPPPPPPPADNTWLYVIGGVTLLAVLVTVFIVIMKKKK